MATNERFVESIEDGEEFPWEFRLATPETVQQLIASPDDLQFACSIWEWEADEYRQGKETDLAQGLREGYHCITMPQDGDRLVKKIESGREKAVALEYFHGLTNSLMFAGDLVGIHIPSLGHFLASILPDLFEVFNDEGLGGVFPREVGELHPDVAPAWEAAHFDLRRLQFFAEHADSCADNSEIIGGVKYPKNQDVRDLCVLLAAMTKSESKNGIARKFVGKKVANPNRRAKSLLRQADRFPWLWKKRP